jgi:hypothetical protein
MSEHQLSPATIWIFQIVPREVLEQKLEGCGGDCTGIARGTDGEGMMARCVRTRYPDFARTECIITDPAPEKELYSGNCGFTAPTIWFDTFSGALTGC